MELKMKKHRGNISQIMFEYVFFLNASEKKKSLENGYDT